MFVVNVAIVYLSYSGSTEEVAELIETTLHETEIRVTKCRIGEVESFDPTLFDLVFFGTFTWGKGAVPTEMKQFIQEIGYKPENIVVFGTGDTQFGGDLLFCRAVDKLTEFYACFHEGLKIEQSPRGSQEKTVKKWTESVINEWKNYKSLKR